MSSGGPIKSGHLYKPRFKPLDGTKWKPREGGCEAAVHDGDGWPSFHQCTRKASVTREVDHNGVIKTVGYCKTHDPVAVAEKAAAQRAKWEAKWAGDRANMERERRRLEAIVVLRKIADGHNDPRTLAIEFLEAYDQIGKVP